MLDVMRRLQEEFGTAILLITHDLGVVAEIADDVVVMYAGAAMETAPRRDLFYATTTPTPRACWPRCRPRRTRDAADADPGAAAEPDHAAAGMPVRARCRYVFDLPHETPPLPSVCARSRPPVGLLAARTAGRAEPSRERA